MPFPQAGCKFPNTWIQQHNWFNPDQLWDILPNPESLGPLACSDHNVVLWSSAASIPKPKIKRVKYRPLTDSAISTYGRWIATYPFTEAHAKYLEFFPEKTFTRCESDKPWITPQFKKIIRKNCKLFQEGDLQNARKIAKSHYLFHEKCEERLRAWEIFGQS